MSQHRDALRKAGECKQLRADFKRRIRSGDVDPAAVLREPIPWWLAKVHVGAFLDWIPRLFPAVRAGLAAEAGVGEARELGLLTDRQRAIVAQGLDDRAEGLRVGRTRREIAERRERRGREEAIA